MPSYRKPRWQRTIHNGIRTDEEGNIQVRVAIKRNLKVTEKRRILSPPTSLSAALLVREELRTELGSQTPRVRPRPTVTVLSFAQRWLEISHKRNRPRVTEVYRQTLRDHILPHIGHLTLDDLTRDQVIRMTDNWSRETLDDGRPYAKSTVQSWWKVTRALIADGCAEYKIAFNPTARVRLPKLGETKRREARVLSAQQVVALLDFVETTRPRRYAEIAILALGGVRPSELFALEWRDITLERGELVLRRSVDRGHVNAPKAARSDRDAIDATRIQVVPQRAIEALRRHRMAQMVPMFRHRSTGLVFPSNQGTHRTPASLQKVFAAARTFLETDVRIGPQVLRRTYNTLMKDLTDMATLHAMIGHADPKMTQLYSGITYERKAAAAAALELMLAGGQ